MPFKSWKINLFHLGNHDRVTRGLPLKFGSSREYSPISILILTINFMGDLAKNV